MRRAAGQIEAWAPGIFACLVLAFLLLPSIIVFPLSLGTEKYLEFPPRGLTLRWYVAFFTDKDWYSAALFSLRIASLVMMVATLVGTLAALALTRGRFRGKSLVNLLVLVPMVVPTIVAAVAIYFSFSKLGLAGTTPGFVLAHAALAFPYVVLTVSGTLHRFDGDLELAAASLGASRVRTFIHVILPIILPSVLSGAIFAFIVSFDESVISFFLSGVRDRTLPRKMFEDVDFDVSPVLAAVASLLTLVSVILLGVVEILRRVSTNRRLVVSQASTGGEK